MSLLDAVTNPVKKWLFSIAVKKGVKKFAQVAIAWVASVPFADYGISVSVEEGAFVAALTGVVEIARNFLKVKYPKQFGAF